MITAPIHEVATDQNAIVQGMTVFITLKTRRNRKYSCNINYKIIFRTPLIKQWSKPFILVNMLMADRGCQFDTSNKRELKEKIAPIRLCAVDMSVGHFLDC